MLGGGRLLINDFFCRKIRWVDWRFIYFVGGFLSISIYKFILLGYLVYL